MQKKHLLTPREWEVLTLLTLGFRNSEISKKLNITKNTTESHLKNIYSKLGVSNRVQAATKYRMFTLNNQK